MSRTRIQTITEIRFWLTHSAASYTGRNVSVVNYDSYPIETGCFVSFPSRRFSQFPRIPSLARLKQAPDTGQSRSEHDGFARPDGLFLVRVEAHLG